MPFVIVHNLAWYRGTSLVWGKHDFHKKIEVWPFLSVHDEYLVVGMQGRGGGGGGPQANAWKMLQ